MSAQRDLMRAWREQHAHWPNTDFEPMRDTQPRILHKVILEDLRVTRLVHSPGFTFRDDKLVKDCDDAFAMFISQARIIDILQHCGRDLRLGLGDATVMDVSATGRVGSRWGLERISVLIPRPEFTARGVRGEDAVLQPLPRRSEALQLLRAYIRSLEKNRLGAWGGGRETIRRHLIDLAVLAITARGPVGESSLTAVATARLNTALDYIAAHFEEPDLSVATVAKGQGISSRYLQRLIETTGESFTARLNELRLQKAFTLLTGACPNGRRISDIAFGVGFSDLSHFNRLFRSRFGDTPRGVRGRGTRPR